MITFSDGLQTPLSQSPFTKMLINELDLDISFLKFGMYVTASKNMEIPVILHWWQFVNKQN